MSTYDHDTVRMKLPGYRGTLDNTCRALGMTWPPPAFIRIASGPLNTPVYRRVSLSETPDGDAARGVPRIAEYEYDHADPAQRGPGLGRSRIEASHG